MNTDELLNKIRNNQPVQLSFKAGKYLLMLPFLLLMVAVWIFVSQFFEDGFVAKDSLYGSAVIYAVLMGVLFWILSHATDIILIGKTLEVKPYFLKSDKKVSVQKITKVKSIRIKQTRYSLVWFTNDFNVEEKFLVLQSNSLLFGVQPPIKDVVELMKEMNV